MKGRQVLRQQPGRQPDQPATRGGTTSSDLFPTTTGAFATAFGGRLDAFVTKLNAAGSAYVTGSTTSTGFPAVSASQAFGGTADAFATKLNAAGTALVYSTFLGGLERDLGLAVALDGLSNAYVTGFTDSSDFPATAGALDTSFPWRTGTRSMATASSPSPHPGAGGSAGRSAPGSTT